MSNFTTIYDELINTTLPGITGFSSKQAIPNPYDLTDNSFGMLRDGYGILVGDAVESDFQLLKETWVEQEISIILTEALRRTSHNVTPLQTLTKSLVEDAILLRKDLLNADQITIPSSIERIDFVNRTAIEYLDLEESIIITTTVNFIFTISETI